MQLDFQPLKLLLQLCGFFSASADFGLERFEIGEFGREFGIGLRDLDLHFPDPFRQRDRVISEVPFLLPQPAQSLL